LDDFHLTITEYPDSLTEDKRMLLQGSIVKDFSKLFERFVEEFNYAGEVYSELQLSKPKSHSEKDHIENN
jgi:hypothetical protein